MAWREEPDGNRGVNGPFAAPAGTAAARLLALLGEIGDLKRTRSAGRVGSVAERGFAAAWAALCAGEEPKVVMATSVAAAVAATRLGDLDADKLAELGLEEAAALAVLERAFAAFLPALDPTQAGALRGALGTRLLVGLVPPFVVALAEQPRAGATCPGKPRLMLEPPENHAEHCWAVAVFGALLSPRYGADPATVFLAGLSHHLHNASMPDSGFTGEMLLGDQLAPVCAAAAERALAELPPRLVSDIEEARRILPDASTPEGRAFHAADVIDRVMQMAQHLRVASVTMPMLLDDWALVHDGPVKAFQDGVLAEMGLP